MDKIKIERINELARKSKVMGLTLEEINEQQILRREYIESFKNNLKETLESVVLVSEDEEERKLSRVAN